VPELEAANVDQVILLNQAGKNTHEDICSASTVRARSDAELPPANRSIRRKAVLAGDIELEDIDTELYNFAARAN
jgi:hypothetical protein